MTPSNSDSYFTYVGHATVLMSLRGLRVITDPVLRDRFIHLRRHGLPVQVVESEMSQLHAILLSHLHHDHTDPASLRRLPHGAPLVVPRGAGLYLRGRVPQPLVEIAEGETCRVGELRITAVPAAHHGSRPLTGFSARALGYIVEAGLTVYFAGDTDLFDEMSTIGDQFDVDVALLPVAGYSPRTPAGHLNPQTAARALTMLRPRLAIPIHWGSLRPLGPLWTRLAYLQDPPYTFVGYARQLAPDTEVRVLLPGESTTVLERAVPEP